MDTCLGGIGALLVMTGDNLCTDEYGLAKFLLSYSGVLNYAGGWGLCVIVLASSRLN